MFALLLPAAAAACTEPPAAALQPGRANLKPMPFQIFQSENHVLIAYEFAGAVRDIYLEDPGPSVLDAWMGQSVGRWEGDTFVIEVGAFNGMTWPRPPMRPADGRQILSAHSSVSEGATNPA